MAFDPPSGHHTPTTGTVPPTAWGTAINDSIDALGLPPQAVVTRAANQSVNSGSDTVISFDTEVYDPAGMVNIGSHPTRITATVDGQFSCKFFASIAVGTTGYRALGFKVNGGTVVNLATQAYVPSTATIMTMSVDLTFASGDYVEFIVHHTEGSALNVTAQASATLTAYA